MSRIVVGAAGTGGHIFPAMAIAQALSEQGDKIAWIGTEKGMEGELVKPHFDFYTLPMVGLRGKGILALLKGPLVLAKAFLKARYRLKQLKPDLVITFGGYITAPLGLAAKSLGIPLIIHEQNALPGAANRLLAKLATAVCESFPQTFPPQTKVHYVGNPLRANLREKSLGQTLLSQPNRPLHLLILGGSQGATVINRLISEALCALKSEVSLSCWHQTGKRDYEPLRAYYQEQGLDNIKVSPFITDMSEAYLWADLIICRAGAMTVSEITAFAKPALFIPAPQAVDDHQRLNASLLVNVGGALSLIQSSLTSEILAEKIAYFSEHPEELVTMSTALRPMAKAHLGAHEAILAIARSAIK